MHASINGSNGYAPEQFLVTGDNEAGFVGKQIRLGSEPLDYFADAENQDQRKLFLSYKTETWDVWLRYTKQGAPWSGNELKAEWDQRMINLHGTSDEQLTLVANHYWQISNQVSATSTVSLDSFDTEKREETVRWESELDHPLNKKLDHVENELFLQSKLDYQIDDQNALGLGIEYSFEHFGAGWETVPGACA